MPSSESITHLAITVGMLTFSISAENAVCNAMIAEKKLLTGAHVENDPDNLPKGDSAWFIVYADDIDALEKIYFTFKFRFVPDNA